MKLRSLVLYLLSLGLCVAMPAQVATVTLVASHLSNAAGQSVTGQFCFAPASSSGTPQGFVFGGGGQATVSTVCAPVAAGALSVPVVDTALSNPANVCLAAQLVNPSAPLASRVVRSWPCLQPASTGQSSWCSTSSGVTTCNLDSYSPSTPPVALVSAGPPGVNWRGAWSSANVYGPNDGVSYNGASYINTLASNTNTPGGSGWDLLAAQGASAITGMSGDGAGNATLTGKFTAGSVAMGFASTPSLNGQKLQGFSGYVNGDSITADLRSAGHGCYICDIEYASTNTPTGAGTSGYTSATSLPTTTSGSGTGLTISITASGGKVVSGQITNPGSGYTVGDKIYPTQAGSSADAYFTIATPSAWTNEANPGDQLLDQVQHIFADAPAQDGQSGWLLIGENDASETGLFYWPWQLTYPAAWWWEGAVRASYLWRLDPRFQAASGVTVNGWQSTAVQGGPAGCWSTSSISPAALNTYGLTTSTAGCSITFHFYGTVAYPLFFTTINQFATFNYSIDLGTAYAGPQVEVNWYTPVDAGAGRPSTCSVGGTAYPSIAACTSPYADRIVMQYPGEHIITITYVGGSGAAGAPLTLFGVLDNGGVPNTPKSPTYYASIPYQDATTPYANYNYLEANIRDAAEQLEADGHKLSLVDVRGSCYTGGNVPNCNHFDGTHPTSADAVVIANAFESQMSFTSQAAMYGSARRSTAYGVAGSPYNYSAQVASTYQTDLMGSLPNAKVIGVNGAGVPAGVGFIGTNSSGQFLTPTCSAGTVVSGPTTGSPANPTCRTLVPTDLPSPFSNGFSTNVYPAGSVAALGKIITGNQALTAGAATVTFPNSFAFVNTTYYCTFGNMTAADAVRYSIVSTTQIALSGTGSDNVVYACFGQ